MPASLIANWKAEIERFAPSLTYAIAHPSETPAGKNELSAADVEDCDLVITTYGMLTRQTWLRQRTWNLAILDEAQAIKNAGTRQARAAKELQAAGRIALTGTPVENRLSDLWSLFDFLNPGLLGSAKAFANFVKQMEARREASYQPLRTLVRPYILRRLKTDKRVIADLPDKTEVKAFCGLSRQQAALYEQAVRDLEGQAGGRGRHPAARPGAGPADASQADLQSSGPAARSRRLRRQTQRQVSAPGRAVRGAGPAAGKGAGLHAVPRDRRAAGQVPAKACSAGRAWCCTAARAVAKRRALVESFQRENGPPFFVLSLKAGGTGLNLTAASQVIHFDRWWNPAVEDQATDRAFRIGQKRNVLVHKFVCRGTVEERIDALIAEKTDLARDVVEGGERLLTEMANDELLEFVALDVHKALES